MLEKIGAGRVLLLVAFGLFILAVFALPTNPNAEDWALDNRLDDGATEGCSKDPVLPAATSAPLPGATKVLERPDKVYAGVFQLPPEAQGNRVFENAGGTNPPILFTFHDFLNEENTTSIPDRTFDDPMEGDSGLSPLEYAKDLWEDDTVLAIAWAVYCCNWYEADFWKRLLPPHRNFQDILEGKHDAFFRQTARKIKENGVPIMLTTVPEFSWQGEFGFGPEGNAWMDDVDNICNHYGDPAWPDGPERVRDLYRHIIDLFREEGVTNVTWFMYAASNYMVASVDGQSQWLHPKFYYPGDEYMDWVGQSVYFTHPSWNTKSDEPPLDFDTALSDGYKAWQSVTDKPIFLPEFGADAGPGVDRSVHMAEVLTEKLSNYPRVKAFAWADSELYASIYGIPQLGHDPNERDAWSRHVGNAYRFSEKVKTSQ